MGNKALCVDDQPDRCQPIAQALAAAGYEVLSASTGVECLRTAEEHHPDVIVLDAHTPVLGGVGTLRLLRDRADTHGLGVIVLSDTDGELETRRVWSAAADIYLTRPVSPLAVVAAANWLRRHPPTWMA